VQRRVKKLKNTVKTVVGTVTASAIEDRSTKRTPSEKSSVEFDGHSDPRPLRPDQVLGLEGSASVALKHILSKLGFRARSQVAAWFAHDQYEGPGAGRP
jgi:hypothetical protein